MRDQINALVNIYTWPSQAYWRYFELEALRALEFQHPILEIGCGDGEFSSLVLDHIDEGIDINPRSVEKARTMSPCIYHEVRCQDARDLKPVQAGYGTIYANCVMEHIPGLRKVLEACFQSLRKGGTLIMTVPLSGMNSNLLLPWHWYATVRRRQLQHINLLSKEQWEDVLTRLGFDEIKFNPYLYGKACKFWDSVDTFACIGFGRYTTASATRIAARKLLPGAAKRAIKRHLSSWLSQKSLLNESKMMPCAAAITATK